MSEERRELPARSDGKKLYVTMDGREVAYEWTGPTNAHHATIEQSMRVREYTTEHTSEISVYDEAGTLLGVVSDSFWD